MQNNAAISSAWGVTIKEATDNYESVWKKFNDNPHSILRLEHDVHSLIVQAVQNALPDIITGFDYAAHSIEHWIHHAPEQRGHKPSGTAVPWLEVAETVVGSAVGREIGLMVKGPLLGLPFGSDIRYATDNWFLHLDVKATGPNDNPDEVVISPNQMSGDGKLTLANNELRIVNSPISFYGLKDTTKAYSFQPHLSPFYPPYQDIHIVDPLLCVTAFLKVNYDVQGFGKQRLSSIEIATTPNGLLGQTKDITSLLRRGKDTTGSKKQRVRIRLDSLVHMDSWRSTKLCQTHNWIPKDRMTK